MKISTSTRRVFDEGVGWIVNVFKNTPVKALEFPLLTFGVVKRPEITCVLGALALAELDFFFFKCLRHIVVT